MSNTTATQQVYLGKGHADVWLDLPMANRHGLIAGATGTGKTVTLKVLAEQFSRNGVPVFMVDVKGDLSGLAKAGTLNEKIQERLSCMAVPSYTNQGFPVVFWDVFGKQGHPIRTTISELGPLLLARLLNLNETQTGVLTVIFKYADDEGLLLLDIDDLKTILKYFAENIKELDDEYGHMSTQSIGAIQRQVMALEASGADAFFGEPALNLFDLIKTDSRGFGHINLLAANQLMLEPKLYASVLLWLLSELFETLPEVGDVAKPKLVLFFDEAHLLFNDMPDVLMDKIKQVMLLVRSKGVGVYFITQNPNDISEAVRGQLGNRIQHAMRAFSANDRKAIKALADSFPENPSLDIETVITELGVGEALISTLDSKGLPRQAERTMVAPPESQFDPLTDAERQQCMQQSLFYGQYDQVIDRESAHELLMKRQTELENTPQPNKQAKAVTMPAGSSAQRDEQQQPARSQRTSARQTPMEAFVSSTVRAIGSQVGRQIMRGLLGSVTRR